MRSAFFVWMCFVLAASQAHAQAFPTPTGLTATATSATQVRLTWNAAASASGYILYRSDVTGPLGTTSSLTFNDTSAHPSTTYTYMVAAADCGGDPASAVSGGVSATTYSLPTISVAATEMSSSSVGLTWTASDSGGPGITGYNVYRGGLLLTSTPITATTYTDAGLAVGAYTYTVTAYDSAGDAGSGSTSISLYPNPTITVTASTVSSTAISLSWTAADSGGPGIKSYNVFRSGTLLTPTPITATSYSDTGLATATSYSYSVTVYDTAGDAGSGTASATTYALPTVSLSASAASTTSVGLTWTASDTGGPGLKNYNVYRGGTLLTATPITGMTYTDTGLAVGTSYTYTVVAYDAVGDSYSASASTSTYTSPGLSVSATAVSTSSISVSWSASDSGGPGIRNYNVYRGGTLLTGTPITATSYTDTGLSANTSYTYMVVAYDTAGDSTSGSVTRATYGLPSISVSASPTNGSATVSLSWTASDPSGPGIRNYNVYRSGTLLTSTPITGTSYSDTGAAAGTTYTYTITAYDTAGDANSGTASVTTTPAALVLATTTHGVTKSGTYTLSWGAAPVTVNHYTITETLEGGSTTSSTVLPASTTSNSYTHSASAGNINVYDYKVHACLSSDESICSPWSNTVSVTVSNISCPPRGCP